MSTGHPKENITGLQLLNIINVMKAISHRQHRLLTTALQEVESLLQVELVNVYSPKNF